MLDPYAKETQRQLDIQPQTKEQERRSQARTESVLARIEDATYTVLRKHEKKPA